MSSLSQRLARLRQYNPASVKSPLPRPSGGITAVPPETGWEKIAEGVWERNIKLPGLLPKQFVRPFVLPGPMKAQNLIFYDLETTGLSGGAGNIAFLIGLGRQTGETFVVTQLFLGDYPGETVLLERYAELTGENLPQVSYNGRSFDSQVLKTRFLLNRMLPPAVPQVDLLYPTRRMWKPVLPNVTLGTIEKELLDFHRTDDLPGREAPDAWFEWLNGDARRIGGVFRHNADDIVSLARLLVLIEGWGEREPGVIGNDPPSAAPGIPPSPSGMARQWSFRDVPKGMAWIEAGWANRDRVCGRQLASTLRRSGNYSAAAKIWKELNLGGRDYPAAVELAKYFEHRTRNPETALEVLKGLERLPLSPRHRKELEHRRKRLIRKVELLS